MTSAAFNDMTYKKKEKKEKRKKKKEKRKILFKYNAGHHTQWQPTSTHTFYDLKCFNITNKTSNNKLQKWAVEMNKSPDFCTIIKQ